MIGVRPGRLGSIGRSARRLVAAALSPIVVGPVNLAATGNLTARSYDAGTQRYTVTNSFSSEPYNDDEILYLNSDAGQQNANILNYDGTSGIRIQAMRGGSIANGTGLFAYPAAFSPSDTIKVVVDGDVLTLFQNNVQFGTATYGGITGTGVAVRNKAKAFNAFTITRN